MKGPTPCKVKPIATDIFDANRSRKSGISLNQYRWYKMSHCSTCLEAKPEGGVPGSRIIGTEQGQVVYIKGRLHTSTSATPICRCNGVSGETPCQEVRPGQVSGIPHR